MPTKLTHWSNFPEKCWQNKTMTCMWDCGSNSHNQIIYCTLTFSNLLFPSIKALGNSMNRGSNESLARLASGKPYSSDEPLWPSEQEAGALRGFLPASLGEGNSYVCSSVMPSWPAAFPTSTTLENGDDLLGWTNMPFLEYRTPCLCSGLPRHPDECLRGWRPGCLQSYDVAREFMGCRRCPVLKYPGGQYLLGLHT